MPPSTTYKSALTTARISSSRGRPPGLGGGIKSLISSHSVSVRSVGYGVAVMPIMYRTDATYERLFKQPLRSTDFRLLLHRLRLSSQWRLIGTEHCGCNQAGIGRHQITSVEEQEVTTHDFGCSNHFGMPTTHHSSPWCCQTCQRRDSLLGPIFLEE